MGIKAFFPLLIRPATVFFCVLFTIIIIILLTARDETPEAINYVFILFPGFAGLLGGQSVIDLQQRFFSWNLPGIRPGLEAGLLLFGIIVTVGDVLIIQTGLQPGMAFLLGLLTFLVAATIRTSTPLRPDLSLLSWVMCGAILLQLNPIFSFCGQHPLVGYPVACTLICIYLFHRLRRETHRRMPFETFLSMTAAFSKNAVIAHDRRRLTRAGSGRHMKGNGTSSGNTWFWVRAAYYRSHGFRTVPSFLVGLVVAYTFCDCFLLLL